MTMTMISISDRVLLSQTVDTSNPRNIRTTLRYGQPFYTIEHDTNQRYTHIFRPLFKLYIDPHLPIVQAECSFDMTFGSGRFEIEDFVTLPAYRQKGYGRLLMHAIQEHCATRPQGPIPITLYSITNTIPFYRKCGFKLLNADTRQMRWQPRVSLLREVMRPIRKPGIFIEVYDVM